MSKTALGQNEQWSAPFGGGGYHKCYHGGSKALWEMPNGSSVYAAQAHELDDVTSHGLILDCTGLANKKTQAQREQAALEARQSALVFEGSDALSGLSAYVLSPTPRVHIAWPDGGAPPLAPAFWGALLSGVQGSLCVCCLGAHGRTGTALAALYMAQHGGADAYLTLADVVHTVRAKHCESAVETHDQIEYLEDVAVHYGVQVTREHITPSYHYRAAAPKPAPLGAMPDVTKATRAVVNGCDVATGIKTSATNVGNGYVLTPPNEDTPREPSKRARKRAAKKGKAVVRYNGAEGDDCDL